MKLGKRMVSMLMAITTVATMIGSAGAVSYSGVNMTTGITRRTLFSDSPEDISGSNSTNGYLTGTTFTANERMDFEFYHHNYTGMTKRFGIVVQNGNSTAVTLTLHNKAIGVSDPDSADELLMTAPLVRNYFQSTATTVTIPAKSSQFVLYTDVTSGKLVNGKLSMTSNKGSVYARIVYGNTSTAASTYFSQECKYPEPADSKYFSGQVNYAQKNVTVNANSVTSFMLGEWVVNKNKNEYDTVLSTKANSLPKLAANFGIPYQVTINNAAGKRLKITPNWSGSAKVANIVLKNAAGTWYTTGNITSGSWYYALGSSNSSTVTIVIPSANYGNMLCEIVS